MAQTIVSRDRRVPIAMWTEQMYDRLSPYWMYDQNNERMIELLCVFWPKR